MIQLLQQSRKIRFLLDKPVGPRMDPPEPEVFDLVSAHVCKHCDTIVQAVYKTKDRLKDITGHRPSKYGVSRPNHAVNPSYRSFLLQAQDDSIELLRERYHFNYDTTQHGGRCPYHFVVYLPGAFNLRAYLYSLVGILGLDDMFCFAKDTWDRFDAVMDKPEGQEKLLNRVKDRFQIVEDVIEGGSPLWLITKGGWNFYTLDTELRNILNEGE